MSEEKKPGKALSQEILKRQIAEAERAIQIAQSQIEILMQNIHHQRGVIGFCDHLLKQYDIPSVPEEKKPLEVK